MSPIGFLDSGLGGLTIMREAMRILPYENMIYLGDTANLPYGQKSPEAILRYTQNNVAFFLKKQIKLLVIACFTASSHALAQIREQLAIPVIGVSSCGIAELVQATKTKQVAILATHGTIQSGLIQSLIHRSDPSLSIVPIACPLFVPLIEEGFHAHEALRLIAKEYLRPLQATSTDAVFLGCTHYPLIQSCLQEILGSQVRLIEPAASCALAIRNQLEAQQLLNSETTAPHYEFYATDDPKKFQMLAQPFLGQSILQAMHLKMD